MSTARKMQRGKCITRGGVKGEQKGKIHQSNREILQGDMQILCYHLDTKDMSITIRCDKRYVRIKKTKQWNCIKTNEVK